MRSTFAEHTLPNGLRVVCERMPRVSSAAVGFLVRTGARHERPHEHGVSHFLEHMCFKGTATRNWEQVNIRFSELGSMNNAFTSHEKTFYYGWLPADNVTEQIELLADMMRPRLAAEDYETERNVILEEIAMAADNFDHHVWKLLFETAFPAHPLAHEILGDKTDIAGMPRDVMCAYHAERYAANNMTLVASGGVDPEVVFAAAGRYCSDWRPAGRDAGRDVAATPLPTGRFQRVLPQFKQQSVVLVLPAVAQADPRSEVVEAFQSLFGGANSRCYWNIVQKGICTAAGAAWLDYSDVGMLALYADGEPERAEEMLAALQEQAERVMQDGFRDDEVQRVRNRRRTTLALEGENPRTRMMQVLDDISGYGMPRPAESRLAEVEAVTPQKISRYLADHPLTAEPLLLTAGPRDWLAGAREQVEA